MTIKLYNTRTRRKEAFVPLDPENVRMYVCGPTVYDRAHLGNARPVVVFDVLYRLLRHEFGADHVTYVRNFTDVDDKINARAAESGRPIGEITAETTQWFLDDMAALGALEPDAMPRATAYIPQMVAMIEELIARGHAYAAEGHVLFAVESYAEYGALSGRTVEDMIAGARVEVAPYKRNPMDFVLWKPSPADLPGWDSPWGRGRPGWHIECSAMAHELLGESFDIHGGGNDLMFPHHENEIAQSRCAHPEGDFARVWMHNEMLQVEGKKMSKSLGNFFTVRDLLDEYDERFGIENIGPAIRLRLMQSHYRSPVDAALSYVEASATKLAEWWFWTELHRPEPLSEDEKFELINESPFLSALLDDLNTPAAISEIDAKVSQLRVIPENHTNIESYSNDKEKIAKQVLAWIGFLGFDFDGLKQLHPSHWQNRLKSRNLEFNELIENLVKERAEARLEKNFARADKIRDGFIAAGVTIKDSSEGTTWELKPGFDPSKLEALK